MVHSRLKAERISRQAKSDDLPLALNRESASSYRSAYDNIKVFCWIALAVDLCTAGDREAPADLVEQPATLPVLPRK
jgi:hypothetical protein